MTLNVHRQPPSEYVAALQQHVSATGGEIDAYVSEIVAHSLQTEVEAARRKLTTQGTFGDWLKQWANLLVLQLSINSLIRSANV